MVAVCNTKKDDVINCVKAMVEHGGTFDVLVQTTNNNYTKLNNNQKKVPAFVKKYKAGNVIDLDTHTLHTAKCKKAGKHNINARIINKNASGLTLCKCCKK